VSNRSVVLGVIVPVSWSDPHAHVVVAMIISAPFYGGSRNRPEFTIALRNIIFPFD
jgi:hypothetical protein